ncbi:hypothetical protein [Hellea balneolensis]|uniref:hypothetical protein n=1 Tax=Hellea balneolensis TaxID=287478 RepID=UPI0003F63B6A|nr:hypothetical protein [Hellea balneolensis]
MPLFGIDIIRRRKKIGGFHAEYIDKGALKKRKSLGLARTFGSATTLIIGGAMCYIALHYIPAYLGLNKILSFSELDTSSSVAPESSQWAALSSYADAFRLKRTYLRPGQTIQAQYAIPKGASLELIIQRCQAAFVLEIFNCNVMTEEKVRITSDQRGTQRFRFPEAGFYRFQDTITHAPNNIKNYRVVWSRV